MNRRIHRRRAALALLVLGLPFLVLLGLTVIVTRQERAVARSRQIEAERSRLESLGRRLGERLEAIRLQVAAGVPPAPRLEFIGRRTDDSFLAPWERRGSAVSPAIRAAIEAGQQAEFAAGSPAEARRHYGRALAVARTAEEQAFAHLHLARVLAKLRLDREALEHYETLARSDPAIRDEDGIPLALYGAERLVARAGSGDVALEAMERIVGDATLAPAALYLIRSTVEALPPSTRAQKLAGDAATQLRRAEQIVALKGEASRIRPPEWITFGDPKWFVSAGPSTDGEAVFAVSAAAMEKELLDEIPLPTAQTVVSSRWFLTASLAAVLTATLAAAWLLWRDVRREVRVSELRAQFISSVSHELRTPLSAIRMYAESLRMGRPAEQAARDEYLDTIMNESERLSRLLDNVLEFSKIERGERTYRMEPTDLAIVVRSAARAAEYVLQQRGLKLDVHLHEVPPVPADPDAIEQAVLNLLTNAMKYSGDGTKIELALQSTNGHATIDVRDHGIGIDPAEQPRIFEKYYRAANAQRTTGAGLGLAIVAHIARAHGGIVRVESEPGRGSTFSLALPLERT